MSAASQKASATIALSVVFALAMAVRAFTKEGEGVLIPPPVYYPFYEVIEANNRKVIENPLVQREDGSEEAIFAGEVSVRGI